MAKKPIKDSTRNAVLEALVKGLKQENTSPFQMNEGLEGDLYVDLNSMLDRYGIDLNNPAIQKLVTQFVKKIQTL